MGKFAGTFSSGIEWRTGAILVAIIISAIVSRSLPWANAQANTSNPTREYQIKASLTFNFLQFVKWPPEAPAETLHLCFVGTDHFGSSLTPLEREVVEGKKIEILRFPHPTAEDLVPCQVLFIDRESEVGSAQLLEFVKDRGVLTIGETQEFLDLGGIIALLTEGQRIVFDINRSASIAARLEISSKLLRLARNIRQ